MTTDTEAAIERLCAASAKPLPTRFRAIRGLSLSERDHEALRGLPAWDPVASTEPWLDREPDHRAAGRLRMDAFYTVGVDLESMLGGGVPHLASGLPDGHPAHRYLEIELQEEAEHSAMFEWFCALPGGSGERVSTITPDEIRRVSDVAIAQPAAFILYVLFGELYFDRVQRAALEADESPDLVRAIDALHRQDEARHISFGRVMLTELLAGASSQTVRRLTYQAPLLARWTAERVLGLPDGVADALGFDDEARRACAQASRRSDLHRESTAAAHQLCRRIGLDDPRLARQWESTIRGAYE